MLNGSLAVSTEFGRFVPKLVSLDIEGPIHNWGGGTKHPLINSSVMLGKKGHYISLCIYIQNKYQLFIE